TSASPGFVCTCVAQLAVRNGSVAAHAAPTDRSARKRTRCGLRRVLKFSPSMCFRRVWSVCLRAKLTCRRQQIKAALAAHLLAAVGWPAAHASFARKVSCAKDERQGRWALPFSF